MLFALVAIVPDRSEASEVTDSDRTRFRTVISDQIDAFRHDDDATAFAHASPSIRSRFGTPEAFMTMVRRLYMPVYRPRRFDFGVVTEELGVPTRRVDLVGPDGSLWTALYAMERQPDGTWRISSVVLIRTGGESV
jgi:hypothetical protein